MKTPASCRPSSKPCAAASPASGTSRSAAISPTTENSSDLVLVTRFESRAALAAYQVHPEHQAVAAFVTQVAAERRLVDYEAD